MKVSIGRVQKELKADLELKPNGRFAVLNVLEAKNAIDTLTKRRSTITHEPTASVKSHAVICGYKQNKLEEFKVAVALANIVRSTHKVT